MEDDNMRYGYTRVSTIDQAKEGYSLEAQSQALKEAGAEIIYTDVYTGTKMQRPEFKKLLEVLQKGDSLLVCKLDRLSRTTEEGIHTIKELLSKGVTVHVLNMGLIDNTPVGRLIMTILMAVAEFERDSILERMREGREIAKQTPGYKEGRPKKFSKKKYDLAMGLLESHSLKQVEEMTGISKATLCREKARRKAEQQEKAGDGDGKVQKKI